MMPAIEYYIVVLLLILMVAVSIKPRAAALKGDVLIPSEASHVLKAVACIVIVMHHFGLRRPDCDDLLLTILKIGGGSFALPLFLMLSAYGITKSEMKRRLDFKGYLNHRVMKLMIPFWVSAIFVTILYAFTAPPISDASTIETARLGEYFPAIGRGEYSWADNLMSCVGLKSVSGGNWFVLVTLVSYLLFFVLKETVGLEKRKIFIGAYIIGLMAFGAITMFLEWPAHYWRNLWALVVGLTLALYEKEFMQKKTMLVVGIIAINIYLVAYSILSHDAGLFYIAFADASMVAIALCSWLMKKCELRQGFNIVVWLSGLSYMVYLIHGQLLNEQWLVFGYHNSLTLIIAAAIIVALPLNKIGKLTTSKI